MFKQSLYHEPFFFQVQSSRTFEMMRKEYWSEHIFPYTLFILRHTKKNSNHKLCLISVIKKHLFNAKPCGQIYF